MKNIKNYLGGFRIVEEDLQKMKTTKYFTEENGSTNVQNLFPPNESW